MPNDSGRSDRTAAPLPQGVVALSLVAMLSTASPQTPTAFEEADPIHDPAIDPPMATASARLPSDLQYLEVTGPQTLSEVAAGRITSLVGSTSDPKESLREYIRSLLVESDDSVDVTRPSPHAIGDALRFVDLLPLDSPPPHVSVADDGEINFFRRTSGVYVDVGFFGDGQIHYYARVDRLGIDVDGSQLFSGRSLPRDLVIPFTIA